MPIVWIKNLLYLCKKKMARKGYKQSKEHIENKSISRKRGNYFNCVYCNEIFYRRPSDILLGHNKYCSRKCAIIDQPMKSKTAIEKFKKTIKYNNTNSRENNPNWRGGITKENQQIRASKEYINWRNSVFARDLYKCQECGAISKKGESVILHAHHIIPFSINKDLRFEINNGQTLCSKCHYKKPKGNEIKKIYE